VLDVLVDEVLLELGELVMEDILVFSEEVLLELEELVLVVSAREVLELLEMLEVLLLVSLVFVFLVSVSLVVESV
jgi:hypothetical protein